MLQNKFNWPLWHWHFEVSSICTLKCPRCPRQEVPETLVQDQLRLDFFEQNFTHEVMQEVTRMSFCGDDGDPIYAKEFLEIVSYLKKAKPTLNILIVTNGSYKTKEWWNKLVSVLNEYDEIHFSIDGWDQNSNSRYRINCDWESIEQAIATVVGKKPTITWAGIVFKFNQNHIKKMENLSKQWGMDKFQMTYSTKFGSIQPHYNNQNGYDELEPDDQFVSKQGRFSRHIINHTGKKLDESTSMSKNIRHYQKITPINNIIPLCMIGTKGLYVNSQGYFMPCCWLGNRYHYKNYSMFLQDGLNIKKTGLENVLNNDYWKDFFEQFHNLYDCKNKCSAKIVDQQYATTW